MRPSRFAWLAAATICVILSVCLAKEQILKVAAIAASGTSVTQPDDAALNRIEPVSASDAGPAEDQAPLTYTRARPGTARMPAAAAVPLTQTSSEEFVGPFPSWKNVRTDYGAVGDGKADDTVAIQKALNDLALHQQSNVLYFPAGVYRVTQTLSTRRQKSSECMGISILGEDPQRTTLKWDGPVGGTLLHYDAWYSRIGRLTLDGSGKAAIDLQWGPSFSTHNETADMVFQDAAIGLQMGGRSADMPLGKRAQGQAENAVLRCHFIRCSDSGITTVSFNSMDIWAWYCHFEDCGYGLLNRAGNFHAYRCLFEHSRVADVGTHNLMVFSFVDNTSIGSKCFVDFRNGQSWGSPCSITGNRVINPGGPAIQLSDGGPYLVMDNSIRSAPGSRDPAVELTWGDQVLIGNRYTVENPVKVKERKVRPGPGVSQPVRMVQVGRFRQVDDQIVSPSQIDESVPVLPGTPENHHRKVFEVPANSQGAVIQAAIDSAAMLRGQRPVVHLPPGIYPIHETLRVPANADLQIVGDGDSAAGAVLEWEGPDGGVTLQLAGPARAVVRDLTIRAGSATGIRVTNCDQNGGLISGNQVSLQGKSRTEKADDGLLVKGLERTDVNLLCQQGGACKTWIEVIGGPDARQGNDVPAQVGIFTGATSTSDSQYSVQDGGRLVCRSIYHEVNETTPQAVLLNGQGSLTVDATRFTYRASADRPLLNIDGFRGEVGVFSSLLLSPGTPFTPWIRIAGSGSQTNVLCMADLFWETTPGTGPTDVFKNTANPPARAAMLLCNENLLRGKPAFATLQDQGTANDATILRMVSPIRKERIRLPGSAPVTATDLTLHRVICTVGQGGTGLAITPAP